MPRGRAWTQQEISCLLALIKGSGEVTLLMASTSRPNEALWREISKGLAAAGYTRNVAQCRSKWKALKQAFYSEWETCQQAGGHSLRVPPYYKTMKKIWKAAGRPVFGERRLPDLVKLPPGKRRSCLEAQAHSSPEQQEITLAQQAGGSLGAPGTPSLEEPVPCSENMGVLLPSPLVQCAKSEPASPHTDEASPVRSTASPVSHAGPPFPPLPIVDFHHPAFPAMKQEAADQQADSPLECPASTMPGAGDQVIPIAVGEQALSEEAAEGEQEPAGDLGSAAGLQGPGMVSLLQSMQQILVQILHTSQQQQVLLESLASDTVSHLHVISDNLVQVGETLHELLLQAHARSAANLPSHYGAHTPIYEEGTPGAPHPYHHKQEATLSPATGFHPHRFAPP